MPNRSGSADLPLHAGRVPAWLDVRLLSTSSQLSAGRLVLGPGSGEAAVFVAEVPG